MVQALSEKYMYNGQMFSFIDFLELSEGVTPKPVAYGSDGINAKFEKNSDGSYVTRIGSNNGDYIILIEPSWVSGTCDISFGALIPGKDPRVISPENYTVTEPIRSRNAIAALGEVIWVIMQFSKQHPVFETFRFTGGYRRVAEFYRTLLSNKKFLDSLSKNGFQFDQKRSEKYGNVFILRRKNGTSH